MDHKIPSDEMGTLRCSDLEVPLFTLEDTEQVISSFINIITYEQWTLMADGQIESGIIVLLSDMCHDILEGLSDSVLEVVAPQGESKMNGQNAQNSSTPSITENRIETPQRKTNFHRVTEEDMQASLGNVLHRCFGVAMGLPQENSFESNMLLGLVATELKRRVNQSLAVIRSPISSPLSTESGDSDTSTASQTGDMVYYLFNLLKSLMMKDLESPKDEECQDSDGSSPDQVTDVQEFSTDNAVKIPSSSDLSVCQTVERSARSIEESIEQHRADPSDCHNVKRFKSSNRQREEPTGVKKVMLSEHFAEESSKKQEAEPSGVKKVKRSVHFAEESVKKQRAEPSGCWDTKHSLSSAVEMPQQNKTFLVVFLGKLLDHIAQSTKTSIYEADFDAMVECLREKTVGEISSPFPRTVGNIHIPIYKELCRKFGSAMLLQAAMVSCDVAFEEAVSRLLKSQLQKSSQKKISFATKLRRFFGQKTMKVTPGCERKTSAAHTTVISLEKCPLY